MKKKYRERRLAKWQEFNARSKELDAMEDLYAKDPQKAIEQLNGYMKKYPLKERGKIC